MKYWNKRTQQGHTQFRNAPIGKVESKFLKLGKQLKRKRKEMMFRNIINACLRIVIVLYLLSMHRIW